MPFSTIVKTPGIVCQWSVLPYEGNWGAKRQFLAKCQNAALPRMEDRRDKPRCMISALWAHLVLDPGCTSRCMVNSQKTSSLSGHSGRETPGAWDFPGRARELGADLAEGSISLRDNWRL